MNIKLSIVIVHYKNFKILVSCINSIYKSKTKIPFEVIIVDNDENVSIESKLKRKYSQVQYIKAPGNIGYGAGNNLGSKYSSGKYILFLNPDTVIYPDTIDKLVKFMEKRSDVAAASPTLVDYKEKPFIKQGSRTLTPLRAIFALSFLNKILPNNPISKSYYISDRNYSEDCEVDAIPGSVLLVRKDIFRKIGGFDENFFLYFEESDLCKRIRELGYKIIISSKTKTIHLRGKSTVKNKNIDKIFRKSRYYYFQKHYGILKALLVEAFLRFDVYILLLFFFNLIFFSTSILKGLYYSPSDILQRFPSFNYGEFYYVKNSLLFDVVNQFHPWYKFFKESILKGAFPLWNPYNAGGVPFISNTIAGIFFPLSLVFLVFNIKSALLLFYFSKLFLIGCFTYLYLREVGLRKQSSIIGALIFNFAGFNITFLLWPQTNVIIFLPIILLLIEKLFNKSIRRKSLLFLLSSAYLLLMLSGHPETTFHIGAISLIYFIFKLYSKNFNKKEKKMLIKIFSTSFLIGVLMSSFQTIPFIEYLIHSYTVVKRGGLDPMRTLVPLKALILNIFPNLFGNPSTPFYRAITEHAQYNSTVGAYIGLTPLFLALIGIVFLFKRKSIVKFYVLLILITFPFIYNVPIISDIVAPLSKYSANDRLIFLVAFSLSVIASMAAEYLGNFDKLERLLKVFMVLVPIGALLGIYVLNNYGIDMLVNINQIKAYDFISYQKDQLMFIFVTLFASLLIIYAYIKCKRINIQIVLLVLSLLIFLQTGYLNINYNPSIEKEYFYPVNEDIKFLQKHPKGKILEIGGDRLIPPDVNMWYELPILLNYDAMDIKEYKILFEKLFDNKASWNKSIISANRNYLDLIGAKYIISTSEIDKTILQNQTKADRLLGELLPGIRFVGSFKAQEDNLMAISLLGANYNRNNTCNFKLELIERDSNDVVISENYKCNDVLDKSYFKITIPKINDSKDKYYQFYLNSSDSKTGSAITFWSDDNFNPVFTTTYDIIGDESLKLVYEGNFKIYENTDAFDEYYFVNSNKRVQSGGEMLNSIIDKQYDLRKVVLLEEEEEFSGNEYATSDINIIEKSLNQVILNVNNSYDGYLVSTNSYYPGWKAYVDGKSEEVRRANFAFYAIYIPAGKHEVIIKYRPDSLYIGIALSVLGTFILYIVLSSGKIDKNEKNKKWQR